MSDAQLPLDAESIEFLRDPQPTYRRLREEAPAYDWTARQALLFSRYDHVRQLLTDDRLTTNMSAWEHPTPVSFEGERFAAVRRLIGNTLTMVPRAQHARIRRLASVSFTPRAVERQREIVQRVTDAQLERAMAEGPDGLINVRTYANELPFRIIAHLVGVSPEAYPRFRSFAQAVIRSAVPMFEQEELLAFADTMTDGAQLLEQVIAEHRAEPRDDLLSDLIQARDGDNHLSEDELMSMVMALLAAGSDTTIHGLSFAVLTLLRHPDALAEVQTEPSLLRNAIEETLRYEPFIKIGAISRFAIETFELDGVTIPKGKMVLTALSATSRDPSVHVDPDRFDIRRDPVQNLTFGQGRHFCLGAHLARLELEVAVKTLLLDRYPRARLVGEPEFEPNIMMRQISTLMIRLEP